MRPLRILLKILLLPITLVLSIIVAISMFAIERIAGLLNIFSGIIFLAALVGYSQYLFGWPFGIAGNVPTLQLAIFATVFAFILSPYGLPFVAMWLIGKLNDLNCVIKSI